MQDNKKMNLSEDIVLEILSRLPVRSLIRFKCVCKTWYALIESPNFVDMHLTLQLTKGYEHIQTIQSPNFVQMQRQLVTRFDDLESLSLLTPPEVELPGYSNHFSNHLNGIVCMLNVYRRAKITLWNPALRQFRVLPPRPFHCPSKFEGGHAIAIGLGFDDATNDYKVVYLERFLKDDPPIIEFIVVQVYNLKSNSWRILEAMSEFVPKDLVHSDFPIFFKGSVHWIAWVMPKPFILTFNITTELFGDIQFPHICGQDYPYSHGMSRLFILDNSTLSLVLDFSDLSPSLHLDVWMMKDYSSWTKQYSIDRSNIAFLLSSWKNDQLLAFTIDGALICCDLPTGQQHHIRQYYADFRGFGPLDVVVCVESLVSVR